MRIGFAKITVAFFCFKASHIAMQRCTGIPAIQDDFGIGHPVSRLPYFERKVTVFNLEVPSTSDFDTENSCFPIDRVLSFPYNSMVIEL